MNTYSMRFYDNKYNLISDISDNEFIGVSLDIPRLKERFNNDFIKSNKARLVEINISANKLHSTVVVGYRDNGITVVDTTTKEEFGIQEFNKALNQIETFVNRKDNPLLMSLPTAISTL